MEKRHKSPHKITTIEPLHKLFTNVSMKEEKISQFFLGTHKEEECVTEDIFQSCYLDGRSLVPFKSGCECGRVFIFHGKKSDSNKKFHKHGLR